MPKYTEEEMDRLLEQWKAKSSKRKEERALSKEADNELRDMKGASIKEAMMEMMSRAKKKSDERSDMRMEEELEPSKETETPNFQDLPMGKQIEYVARKKAEQQGVTEEKRNDPEVLEKRKENAEKYRELGKKIRKSIWDE